MDLDRAVFHRENAVIFVEKRTVIRAGHYPPSLNPSLLWRYRDLLVALVRRDLISKYQSTWLGPFWFVFQPLLTAFVFLIVFSKTIRMPTEGIPPVLFYLSGISLWNYVSQTSTAISLSLTANAEMLRKLYFPRLMIPLAHCLSFFAAFGIQWALVVGFSVFYSLSVGTYWDFGRGLLALPFVCLYLMALALGIGLWVAALTVRYRDFHHLMQLGLGLWMYVSPIAYPISAVPSEYRFYFFLNPLSFLMEFFRLANFGTGLISSEMALVGLAEVVLILLTGFIAFNRAEHVLADSQ